MPAKITDLDTLLGEDKQVRVRGKVYRLPSDIPVELYLRITSFDPEDSEREVIQKLHDALLELFQYGDPKLTVLPLSVAQTILAVGAIYGEQAETEVETRPTRTRGGSASSSKRSRSRSRS